jgi:hypothetical protein
MVYSLLLSPASSYTWPWPNIVRRPLDHIFALQLRHCRCRTLHLYFVTRLLAGAQMSSVLCRLKTQFQLLSTCTQGIYTSINGLRRAMLILGSVVDIVCIDLHDASSTRIPIYVEDVRVSFLFAQPYRTLKSTARIMPDTKAATTDANTFDAGLWTLALGSWSLQSQKAKSQDLFVVLDARFPLLPPYSMMMAVLLSRVLLYQDLAPWRMHRALLMDSHLDLQKH